MLQYLKDIAQKRAEIGRLSGLSGDVDFRKANPDTEPILDDRPASGISFGVRRHALGTDSCGFEDLASRPHFDGFNSCLAILCSE